MTDITESQEIEESEGVILQPSFIEPLQTMIANKPQAEQERIIGQFCLAIYAKINNQRMPEFTSDYSKMAYLMAEYTIISCSKKFKENRKKGIASGKARRAKKEAEQAEQLNNVKPEATKLKDNQPLTNCDTLKTRQLQKTQQPHKPQQLQKEQQLDWQCVAGLELTEQQQQEAIRIRKANNTTKKTRTFTQASLKQFLTQVKYSVDAGITVDEVLEVWEGKQWVTWTHAYYAKERQSNAKPQGIRGSQENISFAQSDAVDKSFDKLKSDINFLADNSDAPEGHAEEFTIEDLREIVTKEIQDRQYNKQQQQVLFNKLQAFLIGKYPDLAKQVKPQQITSDIKQIGVANG